MRNDLISVYKRSATISCVLLWLSAPLLVTVMTVFGGARPFLFAQSLPPREVPAKSIPVPTTVSSQMQRVIAGPPAPTWNVIPRTGDEWKAQVSAAAAETIRGLPAIREALHVKVESSSIGGVKVFVLMPEAIPAANRNRLLVHVHGGCFVSN